MPEVTEQKITGNQSTTYKKTSGKMTCPVCGVEVEMLVGEDTKDGGRKGCDKCWRPPQKMPVTPVKVDEHSGNMMQDFEKKYPKVEIGQSPEVPTGPVKDSPAVEELRNKLRSEGGER